MSETAKRLKELGVVLPKPAAPVANYVPFVRAGTLLFVSGQLPFGADGKLAERHTGKLKADSAIDAAREAARLCVDQRARPGACGARRSRPDRAGGAARRVLQCRDDLRRPAPGDERRVRSRRRIVRRPRAPRANDGRRVASAAQCAGRGRSRVRDQGLRPVNAPAWLIERPIAHRGLHDKARGVIENTLAAAQAAIAGGFAIEFDVQMSDGRRDHCFS